MNTEGKEGGKASLLTPETPIALLPGSHALRGTIGINLAEVLGSVIERELERAAQIRTNKEIPEALATARVNELSTHVKTLTQIMQDLLRLYTNPEKIVVSTTKKREKSPVLFLHDGSEFPPIALRSKEFEIDCYRVALQPDALPKPLPGVAIVETSRTRYSRRPYDVGESLVKAYYVPFDKVLDLHHATPPDYFDLDSPAIRIYSSHSLMRKAISDAAIRLRHPGKGK